MATSNPRSLVRLVLLPVAVAASVASCAGTGVDPASVSSAQPSAQSLELDLRPAPSELALHATATWRFAGRLARDVDFTTSLRAPVDGGDVRAVDGTGAPLGIVSTPQGLRVHVEEGTNTIALTFTARPGDGLLLPLRAGRPVALVATTRGTSSPDWLPVPDGADAARVTTRFALPAGWSGAAPGRGDGSAFSSDAPLHLDGLAFFAGEFARVDDGGAVGVLAPADVADWARYEAPRIATAHAQIARTLGDPPSPVTVVFTPGLDDGRAVTIPGAVLAPVEWLGDEKYRRERDALPDVAAALATQWVGTPCESGPLAADFFVGVARHTSDWILGPAAGEDVFARRLDAARSGAGVAGSVDRATCFAHLVRRTIGEGPFAHALRSIRPGATPSEFVDALEKASGEDLDAVASAWIAGNGVPEVDVDWSYDATQRAVSLTVRQRQSPIGGIPRVFPGTVEVEVVSGRRTARHVVAIDAREVTVELPCEQRPTWLRFDSDARMPHLLASPPDRNGVLARSSSGETATDRVEALREIGRLARESRDDATRQQYTAQLSEALTRGTSAWVREVAAKQLADLGGLEARARLERASREDASPRVRAAALR
ncbi:MAG: hypothetical protein R3F34_17870 [Planctomycetota bacterium]